MKVGDFCTRDVIFVEPKASLFTVAQTMRHHHVGSVVVARQAGAGPQPVGIITDRDLVVEVLAPRLDPDQLVAEDIMSFELTVARESDDLWETVHRMEQNSVRRIPVLDEGDRLAGIFCLDDLLRVVATELQGIVGLVQRERHREAAARS